MKSRSPLNELSVRSYTSANLFHSGFYLSGLGELSALRNISYSPLTLRDSRYHRADWANSDFLIQLEIESSEERFDAWIDVSDSPDHFVPEALAAGAYYFKVNFNSNSIDRIPQAAKFRHRIIPINPGFTLMLPPFTLINLASCNLRMNDLRLLLRAQRRQPRIDWLRAQRTKKKKRDVHFVATYYPSKHDEQNEFRLEVMERLQHETSIHAELGFYNVDDDAPSRFKRFAIARTSRRKHLVDIAQSRAAVYVQGPHTALSFKFGEQLALGVTVIGQKLANNTRNLMQLAFFDEQYLADSPSDIVSNLATGLKHPDHFETVGARNARTFDESLSPITTALNVLQPAMQVTPQELDHWEAASVAGLN